MERVKACEHIAECDEGWEVLRNLCPSTAAVAALRDELAEARAATVKECAEIARELKVYLRSIDRTEFGDGRLSAAIEIETKLLVLSPSEAKE